MCSATSQTTKPTGAIQSIGKARGRLVAIDPTGRFIALKRGQSTITVHDTRDAFAPVFSCRLSGASYTVALHPSGRALARLTTDWVLELRQQNKKTLRHPTKIASSPLVSSEMSLRWGVHGAGWLQYTTDGAYLLFGDVEQRARLSLFEAATLRLLDQVSEVISPYPREPIDSWGEDIMSMSAPAPSRAIAFAANVGDSILVLGVAEVEDNKLKLYGAGHEKISLADEIQGERVLGFCLLDDALFVVDSDGLLTRIPWREGSGRAKYFGSGYQFFTDEKSSPALLKDLREKGSEAPGELILLNGPLEVVGGYLLVTVEQEKIRGNRLGWMNLAYLVFEVGSLKLLGWLEAPAVESDEYLSLGGEGILCKTIGEETFVWRFVPPLYNGLAT